MTVAALSHSQRRAAILAAHPSIAALETTYDAVTVPYGALVTIVQLALAYIARGSFALAALLGLTIGPYVCAVLLAVVHEATHFLVLPDPAACRLYAIAVNIVMLMPFSEIFRQHHRTHHKALASPELDVDVPLPREIEFVGNSSLLKALWLAFNMIILPARSGYKLPVYVDKFLVINWVSALGFGALVLYYAPPAFLFLVLSTLFSQGLHPANARQLQEHIYDGERMNQDPTGPPTYSYYGPMGFLTLNLGHHMVHHDFPRVPGRKLPELRRIAGKQWYPDNRAFKSRGLQSVVNFIFNPNITLADFAQ